MSSPGGEIAPFDSSSWHRLICDNGREVLLDCMANLFCASYSRLAKKR
ncbi:hypothetical protein EDF56_11666 [Novosphingobium sp. PhB165]|nr:hypothetical protein EDF56_11666 [Novosphingobium sp. PhB165]